MELKQWRATAKAQGKIEKALGFGRAPKFPMKFAEFLRLAFGGRHHDERLRLYRKLLYEDSLARQYFQGGPDSREARESEAHKRAIEFIEKLKREGITDNHWYFIAIQQIADWRVRNRIQQRKSANSARWLKENRKKLLRLLHWRANAVS